MVVHISLPLLALCSTCSSFIERSSSVMNVRYRWPRLDRWPPLPAAARLQPSSADADARDFRSLERLCVCWQVAEVHHVAIAQEREVPRDFAFFMGWLAGRWIVERLADHSLDRVARGRELVVAGCASRQ